MAINVKLKRNALLAQDAELLRRENELLRQQKESAELRAAAAEANAAAEGCPECDIKELRDQRRFLEYRTQKELKLNKHLAADETRCEFANDGKLVLWQYLCDFQLAKVRMAEAELAQVVYEIWRCKTLNVEDQLGCIAEQLGEELDACPDDVNPFVADFVKDVLKDC